MKIAFVTTHLTLFGGGGKFLMDYANKFNENGYKITIIAIKIDLNKYQFNKGINLIEVGGYLPSNPLHWIRFNSTKNKYLKILNNLDVDLLISIHFPSNYFCSLVKNRNIKHIYYCLEPYRLFYDKNYISNAPFYLRFISFLLRVFFKKYDIYAGKNSNEIICISNFIREKVKKIYTRDAYLHYIGINIQENKKNSTEYDIRKELKIDKDVPIIFSIGLTHHMKGAEELIIIFHKILKEIPETILLIGGWISNENKKKMNKLINKLNIPNINIVFYGFIDKKQIKYFYKRSILTFFTAIDESYGLIPLESMEAGTPILAFDGAGPSETIIDGKTGFLIKNIDLDDFAIKAILLIKNKYLHSQFSNNALNHVREKFNFDTSYKILEKIIIA